MFVALRRPKKLRHLSAGFSAAPPVNHPGTASHATKLVFSALVGQTLTRPAFPFFFVFASKIKRSLFRLFLRTTCAGVLTSLGQIPARTRGKYVTFYPLNIELLLAGSGGLTLFLMFAFLQRASSLARSC